ncbi:MAG: hypothetical protein KAI29_12560, partial [Cyclobacteriaceae bacterium]|nr:hypothetical protein [Cyclobacteriaceae bacterium]
MKIHVDSYFSHTDRAMVTLRNISCVLLVVLLPLVGYSFNFEISKKLDRLETYNRKVKGDSVIVALTLDSAKTQFINSNYYKAIEYAERAFELSKKFPNSDFAVQSVLLLARSFRDIHLQDHSQLTFNNTLKYYIKAITALESIESKKVLPEVYKEYGDFYAKLNLPDLTIENYNKALNLIAAGNNYDLQKEFIEKIAVLNYDLGNVELSITYYNKLYSIHKQLNEEADEISVLKILSRLYREHKDYDNAIFVSKELLNYYEKIGDELNQIVFLSDIGEISFEAGNSYQADKAFKSYFRIVNGEDKYLEMEIASLRYIRNLITEGDIYSWSMDNGYWSDYKTAIRYYNDAQKYTDFQLYPDLASTLLNRIGSMYFKNGD